ncbi:MAG TPA: hypothetical protein VMH32_13205 [Burkholderiales bacterium]|nr:hypothetical protein [Burkholderiales bacterium]
MNLSWEQEADKAVRMAQALFELSDLAWLDAGRALEFVDPSRAMEGVLLELLERAAEPSTEPALALLPRLEARAPIAAPAALAANSSVHDAASDDVETSKSAPMAAPRTFSLLARQVRNERSGEPGAGENIASVPERERDAGAARYDVSTEPTPARDERRSRTAEPDVVPVPREDASDPRVMRMSSRAVHPPRSRGEIGFGGVGTAAGRSWKTAEEARVPATQLREAPAAGGVRQVSTLPELQALFRSLVAEDQARDDPSSSARPQAPERRSPPPPPTPLSYDPGPATQVDLHSGWPRPAGKDAPVALSAQLPVPTGPQPALAPLDPLREEILLDRLLDRFEERLREQAMRHLGFTGGLT